MNEIILITLVILILFVSTLIRSVFGFGNALLAMPLLVLLIDIRQTTPLVALTGLVIALIMLIQEWEYLEWKDTLILLLSSLVGLPFGLLLLTSLPESTVRLILGLVLIGFGIFNLLEIRLPVLDHPALAVPFGILAGILGGAYNTNGPPVVIYGLMRGWSKEAFRASLQGFFFVSGLLIAGSHGLAGLWTRQIWIYVLISLPGVIGAIYLGERISKNIAQDVFNRVIYGLLIMMGLLMFI